MTNLTPQVRDLHKAAGLKFFEIYVATPLDVCEQRDPKGLYKKARAGIIKGFAFTIPDSRHIHLLLRFTGIDSQYEEPLHPELVLGLNNETIEQSIEKIIGAHHFSKKT